MNCFIILPQTFVSGEYDIALKDFKVLIPNDKKFLNADNLKVKRFGRNEPHVLDGYVIMYEDFDDDVEQTIELYKQQGYEYRLTPFKFKDKICTFYKNDPITGQIVKYTDVPSPTPVS